MFIDLLKLLLQLGGKFSLLLAAFFSPTSSLLRVAEEIAPISIAVGGGGGEGGLGLVEGVGEGEGEAYFSFQIDNFSWKLLRSEIGTRGGEGQLTPKVVSLFP